MSHRRAGRLHRRHELSGAYLLPMVHTHAHASSMSPGRQWVSRGDSVRVALRFCGTMLWRLSQSLRGSCSLQASRGPFSLLSFSEISSWLRVCFVGAFKSCGSAHGGPRKLSKRWSWRRMASTSLQARGSASRGPFWLISFAYISSRLRVCFVGALQSCGSAHSGRRERSERWSWWQMATVLCMCAARLPVARLECSLLLQ